MYDSLIRLCLLPPVGSHQVHEPTSSEPFLSETLLFFRDLDEFLGHVEHLLRLYITIQVMTVADVSPGHKDAVGAQLKGLENEIGIDAA